MVSPDLRNSESGWPHLDVPRGDREQEARNPGRAKCHSSPWGTATTGGRKIVEIILALTVVDDGREDVRARRCRAAAALPDDAADAGNVARDRQADHRPVNPADELAGRRDDAAFELTGHRAVLMLDCGERKVDHVAGNSVYEACVARGRHL